MKKKSLIAILFCATIIIVLSFFIIDKFAKNNETFYLENKYYGENKKIAIKKEEIKELIDKRESFAVFVYQPSCWNSENFEKVLDEFLNENQITVYKIAFSDIKDTDIGKHIKFYPSFIIYKKGEMVDFLEADKDEDIEFYETKEGFQKWFTINVKTKKVKFNKEKDENSIKDEDVSDETSRESSDENQDEEKKEEAPEEVKIENITKEKNKVNIYLFWGKGCPHCAEEFEFLESIKEKYGKLYSLYTFETWYDEDNAALLKTFAEYMKDEIRGVPYTIVGKKSIKGFNDSTKEEILDAIQSQYNKDFDIYFDKVKK